MATIAITDDALGTNDLALIGDDADLFEIFDNAGTKEVRLVAGTALDFETLASFNVAVTLDDVTIGLDVKQTEAVTLELTNVIEPRTITVTPLAPEISENTDTTQGSVKVADITLGGEELVRHGPDPGGQR